MLFSIDSTPLSRTTHNLNLLTMTPPSAYSELTARIQTLRAQLACLTARTDRLENLISNNTTSTISIPRSEGNGVTAQTIQVEASPSSKTDAIHIGRENERPIPSIRITGPGESTSVRIEDIRRDRPVHRNMRMCPNCGMTGHRKDDCRWRCTGCGRGDVHMGMACGEGWGRL